jgi:hypothetical protein
MPIFLVVVGLLMVVTGVKNTHAQLGAQIKKDFTGPGNFTTWLAAIGIVGAAGYSKTLQPFANAFLVLILLVIILKNGGVFDKLKEALAQGPVSTPGQAPPNVPASGEGKSANNDASDQMATMLGYAKYAAVLL